jgi:hypothetical protein
MGDKKFKKKMLFIFYRVTLKDGIQPPKFAEIPPEFAKLN